jgi:hypothetical protein
LASSGPGSSAPLARQNLNPIQFSAAQQHCRETENQEKLDTTTNNCGLGKLVRMCHYVVTHDLKTFLITVTEKRAKKRQLLEQLSH